MNYDSVFDSTENQALLAVCARKTIRTAAIAAVVWGAINLVIGCFAVQVNPLNAGILALGLLMLGVGVSSLRKPSFRSLRTEALLSVLLLCWNLGISIINARSGHSEHINVHGLIFPVVAAVAFFRQYRRLGHLKESINSMDHGLIKEAKALCKQLFKAKLKQSPEIVQVTSKRYRVRLLEDSIFCAQRSLAHAFHMTPEQFRTCITNLDKKRLRVVVRHPLGKIVYGFDRKNSDKIKAWLSINAAPAV